MQRNGKQYVKIFFNCEKNKYNKGLGNAHRAKFVKTCYIYRWRHLWSKTWTLETHEEESVPSYISSLWVGDLIADEGLQIGEKSKLGWLIGLFKHAIWADSLYFLYLLLLSISKILASSQLILALSKGPNWVGVFPHTPEDGNRSSFRNIMFSIS
jgi:hypothetical protein